MVVCSRVTIAMWGSSNVQKLDELLNGACSYPKSSEPGRESGCLPAAAIIQDLSVQANTIHSHSGSKLQVEALLMFTVYTNSPPPYWAGGSYCRPKEEKRMLH